MPLELRDGPIALDREQRRMASNGPSRPEIRTIVVPMDFTESSYKALDYALRLAKPLDASIALLHVVDSVYAGGFPGRAKSAIRIGASEDARRRFDALVKSKMDERVLIEPFVRHGVPEYEILRFAASTSANLIVIGRKLRSSVSRFVFGSVTRDVIDASYCPVLVVPERDGECDFASILDDEHQIT